MDLSYEDHWSKLCMLVSSTSKTADEIAPDEIAQYITKWIYAYGPPEMLQSDNGCEFKGAVETLIKAYGIKIKHDRPRNPRTRTGRASQWSGTKSISVSCTYKLKCTGRCCVKNNLKCSIYCHTNHTLPEDHDCGNLPTLATRTQVALVPISQPLATARKRVRQDWLTRGKIDRPTRGKIDWQEVAGPKYWYWQKVLQVE